MRLPAGSLFFRVNWLLIFWCSFCSRDGDFALFMFACMYTIWEFQYLWCCVCVCACSHACTCLYFSTLLCLSVEIIWKQNKWNHFINLSTYSDCQLNLWSRNKNWIWSVFLVILRMFTDIMLYIEKDWNNSQKEKMILFK